jgi:D-apionolactonase
MEDQRNWSDASYKTYCRPLSRPFPYVVEAGEVIEQRITIALSGTRQLGNTEDQTSLVELDPQWPQERFPAIGLAVEAGWQCGLGEDLAGMRQIVRLDLNQSSDTWPIIGSGPLDLELVTSDDLAEAQSQLNSLVQSLKAQGVSPGHVLALPSAYLKSYQPDTIWPSGATPQAVIGAARAAFPNARIGGGMLTNFTEFNRCPPDASLVDYVSHGSAAIVHAADDKSVFQTIETLPQIFASAQAIAPETPYRLGLVSIGMRSNPYGAGLVDNADGTPRTMTADDPRAATLSGAAWMVAGLGATRGFGIEIIALAGPAGPFGILDSQTGKLRPSYHVVRALHALQGQRRASLTCANASIHSAAALVDGRVSAIIANCSADATQLSIPDGARGSILDASTEIAAGTDTAWADHAAKAMDTTLVLEPYAVAILNFPHDQGHPA